MLYRVQKSHIGVGVKQAKVDVDDLVELVQKPTQGWLGIRKVETNEIGWIPHSCLNLDEIIDKSVLKKKKKSTESPVQTEEKNISPKESDSKVNSRFNNFYHVNHDGPEFRRPVIGQTSHDNNQTKNITTIDGEEYTVMNTVATTTNHPNGWESGAGKIPTLPDSTLYKVKSTTKALDTEKEKLEVCDQIEVRLWDETKPKDNCFNFNYGQPDTIPGKHTGVVRVIPRKVQPGLIKKEILIKGEKKEIFVKADPKQGIEADIAYAPEDREAWETAYRSELVKTRQEVEKLMHEKIELVKQLPGAKETITKGVQVAMAAWDPNSLNLAKEEISELRRYVKDLTSLTQNYAQEKSDMTRTIAQLRNELATLKASSSSIKSRSFGSINMSSAANSDLKSLQTRLAKSEQNNKNLKLELQLLKQNLPYQNRDTANLGSSNQRTENISDAESYMSQGFNDYSFRSTELPETGVLEHYGCAGRLSINKMDNISLNDSSLNLNYKENYPTKHFEKSPIEHSNLYNDSRVNDQNSSFTQEMAQSPSYKYSLSSNRDSLSRLSRFSTIEKTSTADGLAPHMEFASSPTLTSNFNTQKKTDLMHRLSTIALRCSSSVYENQSKRVTRDLSSNNMSSLSLNSDFDTSMAALKQNNNDQSYFSEDERSRNIYSLPNTTNY